MEQAVHRSSFRVNRSGVALIVLFAIAAVPLQAGMRGPGKYSGVVIFDRWDTCFLLSGPYITYISSSVKEKLRPYSGQAVQVDATDVFQPDNPGDALIRQYNLVGLAPDSRYIRVNGLSLRIRSAFEKGALSFFIDIRNTNDCDVWVRTDQIGITILGTKKTTRSPSDGVSEAAITRSSLRFHGGREWRADDGELLHAYFTVEGLSALPNRVQLAPHTSFQVRLSLDISPGEYQILFGYGGGVHETASVASNALSFTVGASGAVVLVDAPTFK
jgi:hypothetical protein